MEMQTETDVVLGAADGEAEDGRAFVHEILIKQEPLHVEWEQTRANAYDALFDVVKHEVGDGWETAQARRDSGDAADCSAARVKAEPEAEASMNAGTWNTDDDRPATDSGITGRTHLQLDNNHTKTSSYNLYKYNYQCLQISALNGHIRIRCGEKRFVCQHCGYKSNFAGDLKRHTRLHTGEKPYECEHCDFKCSVASSLKTHIRTHTGEKPFVCKICDYKCSRACHMKAHVRTHTREKPFECKYCDYKCSESSSLKCHMRLHTGEKPYRCKHCDYKCSSSRTLKHHMRLHTD